jgi:uncharacterized protein (DUF2236 family)
LRRTLDLTLATVFGSASQADEAIASIRRVHERVRGARGGRSYRATDPSLLLWVNATLVDTTLLVYERFVRRLAQDAREQYYEETRGLGPLYGIPDEAMPPDLASFQAYMEDIMAGSELRATDESRRLVHAVLRPPLPLRWRIPTEAARLVTLALLPERIRTMFGLHAGVAAQTALAGSSTASRTLLPLFPQRVRVFPVARGRT